MPVAWTDGEARRRTDVPKIVGIYIAGNAATGLMYAGQSIRSAVLF